HARSATVNVCTAKIFRADFFTCCCFYKRRSC
ncbi:hypothetical protein D018_0294B, partial [Vibrio parahaemolyticus VP2007-007]